MSSELIVQSVTGVRAGSDASGGTTAMSVASPGATQPVTSHSAIINPSLCLDPALGLVVIEYRNNATGAITMEIPSQRQLEAYQRWDITHFGPTPSGLPQSAPSLASPPPTRAPPTKTAVTVRGAMPEATLPAASARQSR